MPYLITEPVHRGGELLYYSVSLVNPGADTVQFRFTQKAGGTACFSVNAETGGGTCFFLFTFLFEELNHQLTLEFNINAGGEKYDSSVLLRARDFMKETVMDEVSGKNGFIFKLSPPAAKTTPRHPEIDAGSLRERLLSGKGKTEIPRQHVIEKQSFHLVDLHIEKLVKNYNGLSNQEIMGIQMLKFTRAFDKAFAEGIPKLIVIHGVGKGKLKQKIFSFCRNNPEVASVSNSHDYRFGFGATEIVFR